MIKALSSLTLASLALLMFSSSDRSLAQQRGEVEKAIWSGQSGGFTIRWTTADLVARPTRSPARTVFSAKALAEHQWKSIEKDGVEEYYEYNRTFELLSVVGSIVSYSDTEYCACGGAHPTAYVQFKAIDLAKPARVGDKESGRAVKLNDLFPESDILKALLADSMIRKALEASQKPEPKTLAKLIEAIAYQMFESEDCSYSASEDMLARFAFHHVEGDQVAVRLSISHGAEVCRGQMLQVGILLPIPASLKNSLTLAANGKAGFLMKDQKRIALDRTTSFNFTPSKKSGKPQ
jgi:hypothetical protein